MMSLRARLLSGVLVLIAVGSLAAGGGTYALRSFCSIASISNSWRRAPPWGGPWARRRRSTPQRLTGSHPRSRSSRSATPPRGSSLCMRRSRSTDPSRLRASPPCFIRRRRRRGAHPHASRALRFDVAAVTGAGRYRVLVSSLPASRGVLVVAVSVDDVNATLRRLVEVELLIAAGLLVSLAIATFWWLRRVLRPLERIAEVAGGTAQGDLDVRVSPSEDRSDIGRLDLALNGMLERLEDAFARRDRSEERLRRFVSSASHELRR